MKRLIWTLVIVALYVLHQDVWWWTTARPLVFGVLPIGLAYHVGYTIVTALVFAGLVRFCWPVHLEHDADQ